MPSHLHADHAAGPPPDPGAVDALISQARRLRGEVDAVRREAVTTTQTDDDSPRARWQRALCDLAVHHLDDLGEHLGQLREGLEPDREAEPDQGAAYGPAAPPLPVEQQPAAQGLPAAPGRAGSAQWNLLTDEVEWSDELYRIFGRGRRDGPLTLDELPSWLHEEDQATLTAMVTGCLVDGRQINGEFRIVRQDGSVRTIHMVGEPVLDGDGGTASMWAVLRDVSDLRHTQRMLGETRDTLRHQRQVARTEHRLAVELQESVLPAWRGPLRLPPGEVPALDLAARYLPSGTCALIGGDWYDALQLPDGATLLTVGDLTGHGVAATTGMAMMLGALRGMALAGIEPGALLLRLNQLLDRTEQPALGSALCCRYDPAGRVLTWSQAGHPAPVVFRNGVGRVLPSPEGVLLGVSPDAEYAQRSERLRPDDLLMLHTDGLLTRSAALDGSVRGEADPSGVGRLLALGPRFADTRTAQDCVRTIVEELGVPEREDDACVMVARVL